MEKENDRLKYTIDRLDHYYESVNNKTAVYIAINTFFTGAVLTFTIQFKDSLVNNYSLLFFISTIMMLGILNLLILARICIPYFPYKANSLYYFRSISEMKSEVFFEKSKSRKEKEDTKDLRTQVHELSCGLDKKFKKLTWVGILLISQFFLLAPITYLIIKKLIA